MDATFPRCRYFPLLRRADLAADDGIYDHGGHIQFCTLRRGTTLCIPSLEDGENAAVR